MEYVVLFVDRDQKFLLKIKEILEPYKQHYNIVISGSIQAAIRKLHSNKISVLFLEYSDDIPEYSYFLSILNKEYPEITVILLGHLENSKRSLSFNDQTPKTVISKDLDPQKLHNIIITALEEQKNGGIVNSVDLSLLLQLLEAEQKSCTLRVYNHKTKERGILFFDKGILVSAKTASNKDLNAAKEIIGWDQTTILIHNNCPIIHGKPIGNLRAILLDTMREKDEYIKENSLVDQLPINNSISYVNQKLDETFSNKWRPFKIYQDPYWSELTDHLEDLADRYGFGKFRAAFLQLKEGSSLIIVALKDKDTVVLDVEKNCPRDRLLRLFLA